MPDYEVTNPAGEKFVVSAPDGASQEQVMAYAKSQFDAQQAPATTQATPPKQSLWDRYINSTAGKLGPVSVVEGAANLGSNLVAGPVSGLAGIAQGAWNTVVPESMEGPPAADRIAQVGGALTYQPKTPGGQMVAGAIAYPFEKLAQGADWVGNKVNNATGSPALATVVNTAIQAAPALLFRGRGKAAAAETESQLGKTAEIKAQEYVRANTSLDWNSLSTAIKSRLTAVAADAGNLGLLDARALERQAALESLPAPVTATRGQLTRDPVQLRNEGNVSATDAGKPIRDTHVTQTKQLLDNLDILKGRVSGQGKTRATAESPEQVGRAVQDDALRAKAELSKKRYDFLYKKARATEPEAAVHAGPLLNMLERSPEAQHLGFLSGWLKKAGVDGPSKQVKLADLQDLRTKATGIRAAGGTDGFYAGEVLKAIDESMTQVPAAAKAWKEAQGAFKKHKLEFEEQGAVERLVTDKSRTDRATALEDTWRKTVIGGSIEDLQKVKRSLLTGGDATTRTAGKKAFRDLQAQTVQHIINEATKSVTRYEDGTPNLTPASMERAIKSIGPEKMREIFGEGTVKQLDKIMEATRLLKTEPPPGFKGSPTLANVIALLEKTVGKVPFLGDTVTGAVKGVANLKDLGANSREVKNALRTPLDDAQRAAGKARSSRAYGNALRDNAGFASGTQGQR